jgi:tRNA U34 2-thiouridine synthase MnmA/TrmU
MSGATSDEGCACVRPSNRVCLYRPSRSHRVYGVIIEHPDPYPCLLVAFSSELEIRFETPEKGVSPGQVVGLWDEHGSWCLGSGVIDSTECME